MPQRKSHTRAEIEAARADLAVGERLAADLQLRIALRALEPLLPVSRGKSPGWDAFAAPPIGSNLEAAVNALNALAKYSPPTDDILRAGIVQSLERDGMPKGPREPWLEELIDNRLALASAGLSHMSASRPVEDRPDTFAMVVGFGTFWAAYMARVGVPLDKLLVDVAGDLGPGVGSGELFRLVGWVVPRLKNAPFRTALATISEATELPLANISLTAHEFYALAGTIDALRGA
jgi:hypothetical protein